MIRKLSIILLTQIPLIVLSYPSLASTRIRNFECIGIGKVTVSPDYYYLSDEKPIQGFIAFKGKKYKSEAFNKGTGTWWSSKDQKITMSSDDWGVVITINGKDYPCTVWSK